MALAAAVQGRQRPGQEIALTRRGGGAVDLTTVTTITGKIQDQATGATRAIAGALTVSGGATEGKVLWAYAAADVAAAGYYWVQLTLTYGDGRTESNFIEGWEVAESL